MNQLHPLTAKLLAALPSASFGRLTLIDVCRRIEMPFSGGRARLSVLVRREHVSEEYDTTANCWKWTVVSR